MKESSETKLTSIVLAGNPNVGKSVFFNYFSKLYVDVSNYPGTTVEITSAIIESKFSIKDTPGVYGVGSFNDEEKVARDIILFSDVIINVVSAISLERDLFLTKQLIDMGKKVIVALNQSDEAKSINLKIDIEKLSQELGVPVYPTVAITGEGLKELKEAVFSEKAKTGNIDPVLKNQLVDLLPRVSNQAEALLILEGDIVIAERNKFEPINKRAEIYNQRRKEVNEIVSKVINLNSKKNRFLTKVSNVLIDPLWGSITALLVAYIFLYQFLGLWIGGDIVEITEKKIMKKYYEPVIKEFTGKYFPVEVVLKDKDKVIVFPFPRGFKSDRGKYEELNSFLNQNPNITKDFYFSPSDYIEKRNFSSNLSYSFLSSIGTIIAGQYGVLTLTVTYLIGLLLPLVLAFYTALAILEDSGYLPRLAVLMDGILTKLGMNGRAIIPLVLGLGCVTMAAVTTRLLTTKREKIIAMTVLGFAIPCSAQLGVIQTLLAKSGGIKAWLVWVSILTMILILTGYVMNKFLPGKPSPLLIDLPPFRIPRLKNIYNKTKTKVLFFMTEAAPAFFLAAFIVAILQVTGILNKVIYFFEPISTNLLHLPKEVSVSFILGMVRRDFGAFGLTDLPMTSAQLTVASVVLTLFVPCIATVSVMAKEQSWKVACGIWISSIILSITTGSILARIIGA